MAEDVLPKSGGYRITFSGESEDFFESSNAIIFAYALALLIIFLVLAAQFESFLHPLTILIAVALSFTGALVALVATGHTLNLFSQIGLVMLVGLVTKNSILIVEFANQLRERGASGVDAAHEAARTRFRPILMTAISTIVGILPIALGLGAGGGLFLIFFAMGWIGPGDVKLMAAVGALQGFSFVIYTVLLTACVGAVMALGSRTSVAAGHTSVSSARATSAVVPSSTNDSAQTPRGVSPTIASPSGVSSTLH